MRCRALAAGLMREVLKMSYPEIAHALNRTSHSAALSLVKRCEAENDLSAEVERLSATLRMKFWPEEYGPPEEL